MSVYLNNNKNPNSNNNSFTSRKSNTNNHLDQSDIDLTLNLNTFIADNSPRFDNPITTRHNEQSMQSGKEKSYNGGRSKLNNTQHQFKSPQKDALDNSISLELTDLSKAKLENQNLNEKNKILVKRANEFLENIANMQSLIDSLKRENSNLQEDKDILTCKLNGLLNLKSDSDKLMINNDSLIKENQNIRTELKYKTDRLEKLEIQIQNLIKGRSEELDSNNQLHVHKINKMKLDYEYLQNEMNQLQLKFEILTSNNDSNKNTILELKSTNDQLTNKDIEITSKIKQTEKMLIEEQNEKNKNMMELNKFKTLNDHLSTSKDKIENEQIQYKQNIEKIQQKKLKEKDISVDENEKLRKMIIDKDNIINNLELKLEESQENQKVLNLKFNEANSALFDSNNEINVQKNNISHLESKIDSQNILINELKSLHDSSKNQYSKQIEIMTEDQMSKQDIINNMTKEIFNQKNKISEKNKEIIELNNKVDEMEGKIFKYELELANNNPMNISNTSTNAFEQNDPTELNAAKNENKSLKNIVTDLRSRVDYEKMKYDNLNKECENLKNTIQHIKLEKDNLYYENADLVKKFNDNTQLKNKIENLNKQLHSSTVQIQSLEWYKSDQTNIENEKLELQNNVIDLEIQIDDQIDLNKFNQNIIRENSNFIHNYVTNSVLITTKSSILEEFAINQIEKKEDEIERLNNIQHCNQIANEIVYQACRQGQLWDQYEFENAQIQNDLVNDLFNNILVNSVQDVFNDLANNRDQFKNMSIKLCKQLKSQNTNLSKLKCEINIIKRIFSMLYKELEISRNNTKKLRTNYHNLMNQYRINITNISNEMQSWVECNQNLTNQNIDQAEQLVFQENIIKENKQQITSLSNKMKEVLYENDILKYQNINNIRLKSMIDKYQTELSMYQDLMILDKKLINSQTLNNNEPNEDIPATANLTENVNINFDEMHTLRKNLYTITDDYKQSSLLSVSKSEYDSLKNDYDLMIESYAYLNNKYDNLLTKKSTSYNERSKYQHLLDEYNKLKNDFDSELKRKIYVLSKKNDMSKKDIDDLNYELMKCKFEFKSQKRELDRQNHTFKLELIKSLNDQYESEYFKMKDQIALLANKSTSNKFESYSKVNQDSDQELDFVRIKNDFDDQIDKQEIRCKNYETLISKLKNKINQNQNENLSKFDLEDLKKFTDMNKESLNNNAQFQEIIEENKNLQIKVKELNEKCNYYVITNKQIIDKNSHLEYDFKSTKKELLENHLKQRELVFEKNNLLEKNTLTQEKLSIIEKKLTKDFLSHIETAILLNTLDNELRDKILNILNIPGLDSLDKNNINIKSQQNKLNEDQKNTLILSISMQSLDEFYKSQNEVMKQEQLQINEKNKLEDITRQLKIKENKIFENDVTQNEILKKLEHENQKYKTYTDKLQGYNQEIISLNSNKQFNMDIKIQELESEYKGYIKQVEEHNSEIINSLKIEIVNKSNELEKLQKYVDDNQIENLKHELDNVKEQLNDREQTESNLLLENFNYQNFKESIAEQSVETTSLKQEKVDINQNQTGNADTDKKLLKNLKKLIQMRDLQIEQLRKEKALLQLSCKDQINKTPTISESNFGDNIQTDDSNNQKDEIDRLNKLLTKSLKKIQNLNKIVELRDEQLREYKSINKELKEKYDNHAQIYIGEVVDDQLKSIDSSYQSMNSEELYKRFRKIIQQKDEQIKELQKSGNTFTPTPSEMGDMNLNNPDKAKDLKLIKKLTKINEKLLKQNSEMEEDKLKICEIIEKSEKEKLIKKMKSVIEDRLKSQQIDIVKQPNDSKKISEISDSQTSDNNKKKKIKKDTDLMANNEIDFKDDTSPSPDKKKKKKKKDEEIEEQVKEEIVEKVEKSEKKKKKKDEANEENLKDEIKENAEKSEKKKKKRDKELDEIVKEEIVDTLEKSEKKKKKKKEENEEIDKEGNNIEKSEKKKKKKEKSDV